MGDGSDLEAPREEASKRDDSSRDATQAGIALFALSALAAAAVHLFDGALAPRFLDLSLGLLLAGQGVLFGLVLISIGLLAARASAAER